MHIHYNTNQTTLPLELTSCLPQDHIVFTIEKVVNELEENCFAGFSSTFGRPSYHPKLLLSALLFAYTRGVFSGRKIEKLMIENMAMQYLTGQLVVSYRTINRFRVAKGMEDLIRDLFIELTLRLKMEDLVSLDCLYIDGTKIEANANKYSFVWKKATAKFSAKLQTDLRRYFQEEVSPLIHEAIVLDEQEPVTAEQLNAFAQIIEEELADLTQDIEEEPVKGQDTRKVKCRKLKKVLRKVKDDFSVRAEKYETYHSTFDGRNSFSKTDTDATFMRMKDDHMRNGQLKAGYNLQIATENQFVLHYDIFPNPIDTKTLIPLLDSYPHNLKRIVADAGYGSEENLTTLDKFGVEHLIKYSMFDKEQKRKQKHSPKNLDNWLYDDVSDTYTHPDGWDYHFESIKHSRTATGFQQDIRVYQADYPDLAPQKCLYVNQRYQELKRKESQALLSEEGGRIFAQRKVDVEPVFGQIKACLGYKRCNLRGKRQVKIDMGLVLMANNLLKYNRRMTKN
ncbi:IS1182 family transposase [Streptococcus pseudoporcinus]|uniref:Transposase IS663-like n=1 Tax=Streptococcus pseudoporcinus TaxID=361101 RepID=A0A4U9XIA1_9STRE|nr:IS1182 family transposase [Streptococcus pseudoporcinus]VTS12689.1 transposase IS663-like [Streptococcus pseudoporcinus]VUC65379.1 transposase IS663-like [Streptococcus pseudoporcinus]VUC96252.1 transposase IS663-like [Streptococcus pseudoporcinus]VUC96648.1 transposase IS663-like [Streptococcus pseudoporcinus]